MEGCVFENCYAGHKGGAIHQGIGGMTLRNSTFWWNEVGSDNAEDGTVRDCLCVYY